MTAADLELVEEDGTLPPELKPEGTETEEWEAVLCVDQPGRLVAAGRGSSSGAAVLAGLVEYANRMDRDRKSFVFRNKKCRRCSQASTGGRKAVWKVELRREHATWLRNVKQACDHPTVFKTLRILIDFFALHCTTDETLGVATSRGLGMLRGRLTEEHHIDTPPGPPQPPPQPPAKRPAASSDDDEDDEEDEDLFSPSTPKRKRAASPTGGSPEREMHAVSAEEGKELRRRAEERGKALRHVTVGPRKLVIVVLKGREGIELHCTDALCPHQGAVLRDLEEIPETGGHILKCSRHFRRFCLSTGAWLNVGGEEPKHLRVHSARWGPDDSVLVRFSRDPTPHPSDAWSSMDGKDYVPPGASQEFICSPAGKDMLRRRRCQADRELSALSQEQSLDLSQASQSEHPD
eukprot:Hpha_TRINITY_DN15166_c0_g1::TRINITY_DN15166_c0_g1_i1::g.130036::m.130036